MGLTPELRLESTSPYFVKNDTCGPYRIDPLAALVLGALAAPVIAVAGLSILLLSRRSPFIAHERVGIGGSSFWMWKLRTMWPSGEPGGGSFRLVEYVTDTRTPGLKSARDHRISSRFALFCRKFSIDELPQLFHVMAGQMSLVGPRPITRQELQQYYGAQTANQVLRLRPGITGLWQIQGRSSLSFDERRDLDLQLVRTFNLRLYCSILLRTIPRVVCGNDSY